VKKSLDVQEDGYLGRLSFEITRDGKPLAASIISASGLTEQLGEEAGANGKVEGEGVLHDGSEVLRFPAAKVTEMRLYAASTGTRCVGGLESTYFTAAAAAEDGRELAIALTPRPTNRRGRKTMPLVRRRDGAGGGSTGPGRRHDAPLDGPRARPCHRLLAHLVHLRLHQVALPGAHLAQRLRGQLRLVDHHPDLPGPARLLPSHLPLVDHHAPDEQEDDEDPAEGEGDQEHYRKMKKSMETNRKMNEEVMALYKKEGVNPMANLGGCLPLLLQMPIFIGFYNMLAVTIEMRQAPFMLWLHDLSRRDPYYITPVLMGASWLLQQSMTSSSIPDPCSGR
jgi:hypothetical protein